jgi:hypothetical protein
MFMNEKPGQAQNPGLTAEQFALTDPEMQFFYFGFYRVLKRYRMMTVVGWLVVAAGFGMSLYSWRIGLPNGIIELGLSACTIVAGLGFVQNSVTSLDAYLKVPFPRRTNEQGAVMPIFVIVSDLMTEIDTGGWQEAYAAIPKMEKVGERFGLPKLD